MTWGRPSIAAAAGVIGYEWIYVPIVEYGGGEPWSLTTYGLVCFGLGVALNMIQLGAEELA